MKILLVDQTHYLYFIQIEHCGPIKIGIAGDVKQRLRQLQTAHPYELNILYFTPCCEEDEKWHHDVLKKEGLHIRGEWFFPGEYVFGLINELKKSDKREGYDWKKNDPEKDFWKNYPETSLN